MHRKKKDRVFREFEKDINRQIRMNEYFIEELPEVGEAELKALGKPVKEMFNGRR